MTTLLNPIPLSAFINLHIMKKIKLLSSLAVLTLMISCTGTLITSTWKAADVTIKKYSKVMVVGIIREADRSIREQMEKHLVGDFKDLGYNAFSAYVEYGPKGFENMNEEEANKKLAKEGIDAVLTIVLLDKKRERYYVPGRVVFTPYTIYQDRFWGYYRSIYNRIDAPTYYGVATKYFWESNFYELSSNKLLYSVQTQAFDPTSVNGFAHEYGRNIIQNMVKNKVLEKGPGSERKAI